jgi:hypothetical protein
LDVQGIMLSRVPLLYQRIRSGLHTGRRDVSFLSDMVNQRIVNETLDLGSGLQIAKRYVHGIQHGPDMACVPATPRSHRLTLRS